MASEVDPYRSEQDRISSLIDAQLEVNRPDRYEPGDPWIDEVITSIEGEIPATMARRILASKWVHQQEGQATRRGNRFLKDLCGADGQFALPIEWHLYVNDPFALVSPVLDQAGDQTGEYRRERVALRAMTKGDWSSFISHGREDAQHSYDAEMRKFTAAEWLAEQQGSHTFAEWAAITTPAEAAS